MAGDDLLTFERAVALLGQAEPADVEQGLALLEEAATAGVPEAQLIFGHMMLASDDDSEAGLWFVASAAEKGHPAAMRLLARLVLAGDVTGQPDPVEALRLLEAALKAGDADAEDETLALLCGFDTHGTFMTRLERSATRRELPTELTYSLGAGLAAEDPELLFEAAIALAAQPTPGREAFAAGAREQAVSWFEANGDDLLAALALD